jgi:regulatory protein
LRSRGVDDEIARAALEHVSTDDEAAAADALARRRLRSMSGLPADVQRRRLIAMLGRKGFGGSLATRVVSTVLAEEAGRGAADVDSTDAPPDEH